MRRRDLIAALGGALVAMALAGGVAWAAIGDGGVIHGCYDSGGNLKVVPSLPCPKGYTELSWNQQGVKGDKGDRGDTGATGPQGIQGPPGDRGTPGQRGAPGADGISVTSAALSSGDANCPDGGSRFTSVNGHTYACNGAQGQQGQQGPPGPQGPSGPIAGYEIVTHTMSVPAHDYNFGQADCPAGKRVLGGGVSPGSSGPGSAMMESYPWFNGQIWSWVVTYYNATSSAVTPTVYATCAAAA